MRSTQGGKKQEMKHRRRECSKIDKDIISSSKKIDHREFWFFWVKNRYGDDEKKGKEEVWKEKWDQEHKREEKMRWNIKKIHKNGDGEKKLRKHEIQKKRERYTKWEIIFQDTEKTKHEKKLNFWKNQQKRKQRKRSFFDWKEKTEKDIFCRSLKRYLSLLH